MNDELHLAIQQENYGEAEAIINGAIANRIDLHTKNEMGFTPLKLLIIKEQTPLALKLIDIISADDYPYKDKVREEKNSLYAAIYHRNDDDDTIAKKMIKNSHLMNLDLNICHAFGNTIIHVAIAMEKRNIVKSLIEMGADLTIKNQDGQSPLYQAIFGGQHEIALDLAEAFIIPETMNYSECAKLIKLAQINKMDDVATIITNKPLFRINTPLPITYKEMQQGPLNKSDATKVLEEFIRIMIKNPEKIIFNNSYFGLIATLGDIKLDISELFQMTHFEHLEMSEEDSETFYALGKIPENPRNRGLSEDSKYINLTMAEKLAIYEYTYNSCAINDFLHEKFKYESKNQTVYLLALIAFLASAINKIEPDIDPSPNFSVIYRGEKEYFLKIQDLKNNTGTISKKPGFVSASGQKEIAENFQNEDCRILLRFPSGNGKNISELSYYPEEDERIMPPSFFDYNYRLSHSFQNEFDVRLVRPLLEQNQKSFPNLAGYSETLKKLLQLKNEHGNNKAEFTSSKKKLIMRSSGFFISKSNTVKNIFSLMRENMLHACGYVYENYLKYPYTKDIETHNIDWELVINNGTAVIHRPNHGLAHTLRVAALVPIIAQALKENPKNYHLDISGLDKMGILKMQLVSLFLIVGRENDCSFRDDPVAHNSFKKTSSEAFINYVSENNWLSMTVEEIERYSNIILNLGSLEQQPLEYIILLYAHKLDLLRCYGWIQYTASLSPLHGYLDFGQVRVLIDYAHELIHATGDRDLISDEPSGYQLEKFYLSSTDPISCLQYMLEVEVPEMPEPVVPIEPNDLFEEGSWTNCTT